jgi:hypothetical protein
MPAHVEISFHRTHDLELAQQAAVFWNARRNGLGEGASQGAGRAIDYQDPISTRLPVWPAQGKCGLGLGRLGTGSLGQGQYHGPANYGLGFGQLGIGSLGLYVDRWRWNTSQAQPRLAGLRDGPYRFGLRFFDEVGNLDLGDVPEATVIVMNTPRPPRDLSVTPAGDTITLNWTSSLDIGST